MEEESNCIKLLKRSEPFPFNTPWETKKRVALLIEYKDHYYFLLRWEDDGKFIGPEDLTPPNAYDTLLEALLVWRQACDDVKKKQIIWR